MLFRSQILRHRSFSFQEFSQRYADPTKELDLVPREARMQDHKNRQNSVDITPFDGDRGMQLKDDWHDAQMRIAVDVLRTYNWAIENGIAKEQAREILPEGLTESRLYMNGTLRSWIHYIELRSGNGTQKEHREVAVACANAITPIFPLITEFVQ